MQLPNALQISFHIGARQMTRAFWARTKAFADAGCMALAAKSGLMVNQNNRIREMLSSPKNYALSDQNPAQDSAQPTPNPDHS
tara:strand:+ start:433 stop:681 length:249 start_codon:yes stop_codon:yes gene_type:complete